MTLPKPLVEFGNKPMILHQVEALVAAGVKGWCIQYLPFILTPHFSDIVLAVNYRPEIMVSVLKEVLGSFPPIIQS